MREHEHTTIRRAILGAIATVGGAYAEGRASLSWAQTAVDRVVGAAVQGAPPLFATLCRPIEQLVSDASDLSDASDRIATLYLARADRAGLGRHLATALQAADELGVVAVRRLTRPTGPTGLTSSTFADWGTDTPFTDARDFFHAQAFTMVGVSHADLLGAVKTAIETALVDGTTLQDFRKDLPALFDRYGVTAPDPHRIETLYRTNLQRAYGAAQYRELTDPAVATRLPYWRYVAVMDDSTRASHAAMHGRIYRWDDPIWQIWTPPCGFNCRCHLQPLSEADLGRRGWAVETAPPDVEPDPYFAGRGASLEQILGRPEGATRWTPAPKQPGWRKAERPSEARIPAESRVQAPDLFPSLPAYDARGLSRAEALLHVEQDYKRLMGIAPRESAGVLRDVLGDAVTVDLGMLAHMVRHPEGRERYLAFLRPTIESPYEVWLSDMIDGTGAIRPRKRYLGVYREADATERNVVVIAEDGPFGLLWDAFQADPGSLNSKRKGVLLYGRA